MAIVELHKDDAIHIKGRMTVANAAYLKDSLMADAFNGKAVTLDLSGVEEMDSAGFQLLVLARREAANKRLPFRVSSASRAVMDVLSLFRAEKDFIKGVST